MGHCFDIYVVRFSLHLPLLDLTYTSTDLSTHHDSNSIQQGTGREIDPKTLSE